MPSKRGPERDAEYERDRRFALEFAAFLDSLPRSPTMVIGEGRPDGGVVYREVPTPELNLAASLADGLDGMERGGRRPTGVRAGLRMALQDLLEMSRDLAPAQVAEADRRLEGAGCPTLSVMRHRVWQTIPKVLKRGRIRTEAEYYLLIERLNDVDDSGLSVEQRDRLGGMVAEYEDRRAKARPPAA